MAKLFTNETRRPVGWPASIQAPVSSSTVWNRPDLGHLAAHTLDLHPVTDADAVLAHQHEPAEEGDDEVLHRHGETGAGEAEDGGGLPRDPDDDEEDQQRAHHLHRELHHGSERP